MRKVAVVTGAAAGIGRKIAVLPTKRTDQQRITFHIENINDA